MENTIERVAFEDVTFIHEVTLCKKIHNPGMKIYIYFANNYIINSGFPPLTGSFTFLIGILWS